MFEQDMLVNSNIMSRSEQRRSAGLDYPLGASVLPRTVVRNMPTSVEVHQVANDIEASVAQPIVEPVEGQTS